MKKLFLLLVIMAVSSTSFFVSAKIWRVNNISSISADFNDLDVALASANVAAGDTIYLEGSPTDYLVSDIVKSVTIIGPGYLLTDNPNTLENKSSAFVTPKSGSYTYILGKGCVFEGLSFTKYVYVGADNVVFRKCDLTSIYFANKATGIQPINHTIVTQCFLNSVEGNLSVSSDYSEGAIITNNLFTARESMNVYRLYNATIEYNTCWGTSGYAPIYDNSGSGTIKYNIVTREIQQSHNPMMTLSKNLKYESIDFIQNSTSEDGKFILAGTSSLKTAGSGGKEIGAFGGASPYILSGLPNVPHIYEIDAPAAASTASGLQVKIKIAAEK